MNNPIDAINSLKRNVFEKDKAASEQAGQPMAAVPERESTAGHTVKAIVLRTPTSIVVAVASPASLAAEDLIA